MIVGHHALRTRIDELFPKEKPYKIGAASVDVCVGNEIIREGCEKVKIHNHSEDTPVLMEPGEFLLVVMKEHTVVPKDLCCLFLLKSTMARMGMNHMFAGWIDPGWDGMLTMELKNNNQERPLPLWPGMPIGQLIYMPVLDGGGCYGGRYQHSEGVVAAREEIEYDAGA
jgi:dCTP deaminase